MWLARSGRIVSRRELDRLGSSPASTGEMVAQSTDWPHANPAQAASTNALFNTVLHAHPVKAREETTCPTTPTNTARQGSSIAGD
jgi:hypothetical protein